MYDEANNAVFDLPLQAQEFISDTIREGKRQYINYQEAVYQEQAGEYQEAYYLFKKCDGYEDSNERADTIFENHKDIFYELAIQNYESGTQYDFEYAKELFEILGNYEKSVDYLNTINDLKRIQGTYKVGYLRYIFSGSILEEYNEFHNRTAFYRISPVHYDGGLRMLALRYSDSKEGLLFDAHIPNTIKVMDVNINDNKDIRPNRYTGHWRVIEKKSNSTSSVVAPAIGMTEEQIRNSTWGEPYKVNKTTNVYGVSEQWCYSGYRYIYFDDGIVTAIQE